MTGAATGAIGGRPARCLTPGLQLACHGGYEPDELVHGAVPTFEECLARVHANAALL